MLLARKPKEQGHMDQFEFRAIKTEILNQNLGIPTLNSAKI